MGSNEKPEATGHALATGLGDSTRFWRRPKLILLWAGTFTVAWISALGIYFWNNQSLFMEMAPNELGDLLAGWFAPLAWAWVLLTINLNWWQLRLQREKDEKDLSQLRKETDQKAREQSLLFAARMTDRLSGGIELFTRTHGGVVLRDPGEAGSKRCLADILGESRIYVDLTRSNQIDRALERLNRGLSELVVLIKEGWIFEMRIETLANFSAEIRMLRLLAAETSSVCTASIEERMKAGVPIHKTLADFGICLADVDACIAGIDAQLRLLDEIKREDV